MPYSERIVNGDYLTVGLDADVHSSRYLIPLVDCGWGSPFFINEIFIAYTTMAALEHRRLKLRSSLVRQPVIL